MKTIQKPAKAETEIKKSQFISYLIPFSMFETTMEQLRKNHTKARHFVWAHRTLNEHGQVVENCSDDGEPKNTSGKPTLKVLQGHSLIDTAVITVRYFGGVKLGTGGLVRAYNEAAQLAVAEAELIDTDSLSTLSVIIPYSMTRQADYQIERLGLTVLDRIFETETVTIKLQGESAKLSEFEESVK